MPGGLEDGCQGVWSRPGGLAHGCEVDVSVSPSGVIGCPGYMCPSDLIRRLPGGPDVDPGVSVGLEV